MRETMQMTLTLQTPLTPLIPLTILTPQTTAPTTPIQAPAATVLAISISTSQSQLVATVREMTLQPISRKILTSLSTPTPRRTTT